LSTKYSSTCRLALTLAMTTWHWLKLRLRRPRKGLEQRSNDGEGRTPPNGLRGNPTEETSTLQGGHRSQRASRVKRTRLAVSNSECRNARGSQLPARLHERVRRAGNIGRAWVPPPAGLKQKNLIGIPWMVAFALRADGWFLRQDIIWHKPNPMPESVTDRCTKAHEYLFLLSKSERYHYDADAIMEELQTAASENYPARAKITGRGTQGAADARGSDRDKSGGFPPRKMVGSNGPDRPSRGVPPGAATRRRGLPPRHEAYADTSDQSGLDHAGRGFGRNKRSVWTVATQPFSEAHFATFPPALIEPCIKAGCPHGSTLLDLFGGAGTTALVAASLGRNATLIELNPEYAKLARARIEAAFMGKEEGARHMTRSLGKVLTTFEPGSLFAGLEVDLSATARDEQQVLRYPEPAESIDPGQIATGGPEEECPLMEAKQPGEQDAGETIAASARAVSSLELRAPVDPAAVEDACAHAPPVFHSNDQDALERRRALLAVAAGERIGAEAVCDLVGAGFVRVTTSRLVVTEEGDTWLRSTEAELSS